ncbi:CDP-glycerol glycerophosphotransferase family protein [Methanogenium cariaci]|uniref:CDP-glycerol glycerophosphotransferase family protein n=1 Tax=Methanogenium cariaci TaxID=2197 RepID=UPI00078540A4|nr:CDP-glycerol glycerophosphotransferase family protein [Methanogenium cariaci]
MTIIDFYHVDSFEIFEYLNIAKNLEDLGCEINLVLPDSNTGWFDKTVAEEIYDDLGIKYSHLPSANVDMVITTQYHNVINIPEYKNAISCRLVYGINSEKNFTYSYKSSIPFDIVVCPGEFSFNLLKRYTHPIIGGYPKYDPYFLGKYQRDKLLKYYVLQDNGKKNILYLPTWASESSLGNCDQFLVKLSNYYNIIIKPHHVSLRKEKFRWQDLSRHNDLHIISNVSPPLPELLTLSDIVISDALSGSFWESILIGQKPTLG